MTTNTNQQPSDVALGEATDHAAVTTRPMSPLEAQLRIDFEDVRTVVDNSKVAITYEHLTVTRSKKGEAMGRPRKLTMRAFLILCILTCLRERPPSIAMFTKTANELPDDLLEELGPMERGSRRPRILKSQVGHVFNLLANNLDLSPLPPGKRLGLTSDGNLIDKYKAAAIDRKCLEPHLTEEDLIPTGPSRRLVDRSEREWSPEILAARKAELNGLIDRMLQATVPSEVAIRTTAVDWTDREAWARGGRHATKSRDGVVSADPDASWGRRRPSGNHFSPPGRPKEKVGGPLDQQGFETDKTEYFFGYIVHIAVAAGEVDESPVPEIALALRVAPANDMDGVGPALIDMVDSISADTPIDHAIVDRGYSMRRADAVHLPLADRGLHLTFDLSKQQRERHGTVQGAVMMGGDFYCPLVPSEITVDGIPGPQATREDWADFHRRRTMRESWMMSLKGRPSADLQRQRLVCPALAGKVRCPLREESQALPIDKDVPEIYETQVEHLRDARPACCTAKSITVRQEDGKGRRQRYRFGSVEWIRSYDRRTASERVISHYKKLMHTNRDDIQMFGLTRQTLAVGFASVALNIRLLRNGQH